MHKGIGAGAFVLLLGAMWFANQGGIIPDSGDAAQKFFGTIYQGVRSMSRLLPIVDNLERALASAEESEQHLAEGVRLVHSELVAVLARNGVEQFDPKGESFDPTDYDQDIVWADGYFVRWPQKPG